MLTRMTHDAAANDVLHQLGGYTGQADRAVICSVIAFSFFKDWYYDFFSFQQSCNKKEMFKIKIKIKIFTGQDQDQDQDWKSQDQDREQDFHMSSSRFQAV